MANNCLNTLMKLDGSYLDGIFDLYIEDKVPADNFGHYLDGNFNFGKVIPEPDLIKIAMFLSEYRINKLDLPESCLNNDTYSSTFLFRRFSILFFSCVYFIIY